MSFPCIKSSIPGGYFTKFGSLYSRQMHVHILYFIYLLSFIALDTVGLVTGRASSL